MLNIKLFIAKILQTSAMKFISNCRVQLYFMQKYKKYQYSNHKTKTFCYLCTKII